MIFKSLRYSNYRLDAVTGKLDSSGNLIADATQGLQPNYIWVRLGDDRTAVPMLSKIRAVAGVDVVVAYDRLWREDVVLEVNLTRTQLDYAAAYNVPLLPANMSTPVSARDLVPGGVFADSSGGLYVRVGIEWHENGYYADSTALTLAPTATSGMKSLAVVGVNRLTNAATYTLTADRSSAFTLIANSAPTSHAVTDIMAVVNANPQIDWRGAVELKHGDTEVNPAKIVPLPWLKAEMVGADGSTAGVAGLVPRPAATDNVKALFGDGSYYSVIKADGSIAMTGALNFNGQDANAVNWLNFDDSTELTISAGAITATQTFHRVDTEADASADDLDTISGGSDGRILVLRAENGGRSVVIKHNTGNIQTYSGTDVTLSETYMPVLLVYDGALSKWLAFGGGGSGGGVSSVVAGTNISVDNTDPANPVVSAPGSPGGGAAPSICEGRLTLTSGTPITTTDVTAAGTVYWAPHRGNYIGLYNGSAWELLTFSELSISLSGLLPHSIHDMFIYNNSGTPTLELTAWTAGDTGAITGATNATPIVITTSGTAPATGAIVTISGVGGNTAANGTFRVTNLSGTTFSLQTLAANANVAGSGAYTSGGNWYKADYTGTRATAITTQDGISVKTGATTRRLLGTIRITSTAGQTEDSVARRLVSNLYNPAIRPLQVNEGTNSYSYGTAAWRPLNNSLLNRVEIVTCEDRHVTIDAIHNANRVSGNQAGTGIDVDGISTDDSVINGWLATGNASLHAKYRGYQAAGFHYFQQLEVTNGASQTFYGDFGSTYPKTGMSGEILG